MTPLQVATLVLGLGATLVALALLGRVIVHFVRSFALGQPVSRADAPAQRSLTLVREFLGHHRMARKPVVAVAHWVVMISFGLLFLTLVTAYGQLFAATFALPFVGHFLPLSWLLEAFGWGAVLGILVLAVVRQVRHPRSLGRRSRFWGSSFWQAYFVEAVILAVGVCILALRGLEYALGSALGEDWATPAYFPTTAWIGSFVEGRSVAWLSGAIAVVALLKILVSMAWLIVISLTPTMGVAWHRFLAFPNIWFKRNADGRTALGALEPVRVDGKPLDFAEVDELDEDTPLGVGKVEDFTWKGLLDFSTCTECGRCQEQCPAWHTDKPLSPKMLVVALRNHHQTKAPWLLAGGADAEGTERSVAGVAAPAVPASAVAEAQRPLVGPTIGDPSLPDGGGVIDPDVLWSCTTCGACVEQCPVDIEHVDAIVDMRRYQTLIESAFPTELAGMFKNLENRQNPWGMSARARLDWAKDLDFDVPVVGGDVADLTEVEWLFWVGCAGAYEDRAKKTTRAVAELLHLADVSFAVLGDGEACTGDPARRSGNEFLYQALAQQNVETLGEAKATKVVVTCAHCFNTLRNEYPQLGATLEVVHHTQLLNRLVRDKRLTPVARPDRALAGPVASTAPSVTYHDPCYLGRHNGVYTPPRELIGSLPGVELSEMPRSGETSFCCGAGGARMWMEEKLGKRINLDRTEEALATGAERIAIGCPFCRVMLSDGLTQKQAEGASESVQVVDIAQMLLASVRPDEAASDRPGGRSADEGLTPEHPEGDAAAPVAAGGGPTERAGTATIGAATTEVGEPASTPTATTGVTTTDGEPASTQTSESGAQPDWLAEFADTPATPEQEPGRTGGAGDERTAGQDEPGRREVPGEPSGQDEADRHEVPGEPSGQDEADRTEASPPAPPTAGDQPDWLADFADTTETLAPAGAGPPAEQDQTESLTPAPPPVDDQPDWLAEFADAPADTAPPSPEPVDEPADATETLPTAGDQPDWLAEFADAPADTALPSPEPDEEAPADRKQVGPADSTETLTARGRDGADSGDPSTDDTTILPTRPATGDSGTDDTTVLPTRPAPGDSGTDDTAVLPTRPGPGDAPDWLAEFTDGPEQGDDGDPRS